MPSSRLAFPRRVRFMSVHELMPVRHSLKNDLAPLQRPLPARPIGLHSLPTPPETPRDPPASCHHPRSVNACRNDRARVVTSCIVSALTKSKTQAPPFPPPRSERPAAMYLGREHAEALRSKGEDTQTHTHTHTHSTPLGFIFSGLRLQQRSYI